MAYGLAREITQITKQLTTCKSQLSGWKKRFSSFLLEKQSCVLNIPGLSGDLWVQGPSCYAPNTVSGE